MTRGPYFETHELFFGSFLELRARPAEPVGHFGSISGKRCEKKSQMEVRLELQMGCFSVHFQYLFYFVGVVAGAWRRLVSGCSFCNVLWELGKRDMDLTSVFTVPNAHHIFGSRV